MEDLGVTHTSNPNRIAFIIIAIGSFFALVLLIGVIVMLAHAPTAQEKCQEIADTYHYVEANGTDNGCMLRKANGRWVDTSHLSRADMLNYKEKHA